MCVDLSIFLCVYAFLARKMVRKIYVIGNKQNSIHSPTIFECGSMCMDFDNNFKFANFTASQEMLVCLKWEFKSHQKTNSLPFGRQRTI